jgi:hypothetical protein
MNVKSSVAGIAAAPPPNCAKRVLLPRIEVCCRGATDLGGDRPRVRSAGGGAAPQRGLTAE